MTTPNKRLISTFVVFAFAAVMQLSAVDSAFGQDSNAELKETIQALIDKLDSKRFADRNEGTQKLTALGKAAVESLKEAAKSENSEVSTRSIQILQKHLDSTNESLKKAAKAALESLAEGEGEVAQRAADALKPKIETPEPERRAPRNNIQLGGGNIQIQVQAFGGGGRNMRMKTVNGVKEIDVEENGEKIKIVDDPNNGIKVEVTKKGENGEDETKKYEAKNADELKQKHPEAHKLYEKYNKANPIGIQIQGAPVIPQQIMPAQQGQIQIAPQRMRFDPKKASSELRNAQKEIRQLIEAAKRAGDDPEAQKKLLEKLTENLEETEKKLDEAMKSLGPFGR